MLIELDDEEMKNESIIVLEDYAHRLQDELDKVEIFLSEHEADERKLKEWTKE